jgi:hypothetical protein
MVQPHHNKFPWRKENILNAFFVVSCHAMTLSLKHIYYEDSGCWFSGLSTHILSKWRSDNAALPEVFI